MLLLSDPSESWCLAMTKINEEFCTGCGLCLEACPHQAIFLVDNIAQIDYDHCDNCGRCGAVCPRKAIVVSYEPPPQKVITHAELQKRADSGLVEIHKTPKSQLLLDICDLFIKIANIFVDHYNRPSSHPSSGRTSMLQQRLSHNRPRQRRYRGGVGKRGGGN